MTSAETTICKEPRPNSVRRKSHKRRGFISRPIRKSSSTTPSSVNWRTPSTSVVTKGPGVCGPTITPVTSSPRIDPRPKCRNTATAIDATTSRSTAE